MKIAIDGRPLTWTGIGRYLNGMLPALLEIDKTNNYVFLVNKNQVLSFKSNNVEVVTIRSKPFSIQEQVEIPFVLRKNRVHCYYSTHFNIPLLLPKSIVLITSIYDLAFSIFPKQSKSIFHRIYYEIFLRFALKKSKTIIVQSDYTKANLVKYFNYSEAVRVYPGFHPFDLGGVVSQSVLESRYGIRHPYILYVGVNKYHKNLKTLVRAFAAVIEKRSSPQLQLVIAGSKNSFYYDIEDDARRLGITKNVVLTDYIDDNTLTVLYSSALMYISPAYLESGFSYPILEAQSAGVPVIASELDLQELCSDSVLYFNPYKIKDCIQKIELLLQSELLQKSLTTRGKENVKRFTVEKSAREILACFERYLNV